VFPDTDDSARLSKQRGDERYGIPQITAIMGMCRGGRRLPSGDVRHILMTEGSVYFWRAPRWCKPRSARNIAEDLAARSARADQWHGGFP